MIVFNIIKGLFQLTFWLLKSYIKLYVDLFMEQPEITIILTIIIIISWII